MTICFGIRNFDHMLYVLSYMLYCGSVTKLTALYFKFVPYLITLTLDLTRIFSGYIGSVSFLNTVLDVVGKLRSVNPELTYGETTKNAYVRCPRGVVGWFKSLRHNSSLN